LRRYGIFFNRLLRSFDLFTLDERRLEQPKETRDMRSVREHPKPGLLIASGLDLSGWAA
jgi:hypothetical protein